MEFFTLRRIPIKSYSLSRSNIQLTSLSHPGWELRPIFIGLLCYTLPNTSLRFPLKIRSFCNCMALVSHLAALESIEGFIQTTFVQGKLLDPETNAFLGAEIERAMGVLTSRNGARTSMPRKPGWDQFRLFLICTTFPKTVGGRKNGKRWEARGLHGSLRPPWRSGRKLCMVSMSGSNFLGKLRKMKKKNNARDNNIFERHH